MRGVSFDTVRSHFRALGQANAISARYLGQQYYHTVWDQDKEATRFLWKCTEYPDPCLDETNNSHNKESEANSKLKEYKWDKDIQIPITITKGGKKITTYKTMPPRKIYQVRHSTITGKQAYEAWAKTTILLPIAIIFNKLQGWRNDDTTQKTCQNRGENKTTGINQSSINRVYDYRFITPDESKILAENFPSCIDPSLITKKEHVVPLTNKQKQQKAAQNQEKQSKRPNTIESQPTTNEKKRKRKKKPLLETTSTFTWQDFRL